MKKCVVSYRSERSNVWRCDNPVTDGSMFCEQHKAERLERLRLSAIQKAEKLAKR